MLDCIVASHMDNKTSFPVYKLLKSVGLHVSCRRAWLCWNRNEAVVIKARRHVALVDKDVQDVTTCTYVLLKVVRLPLPWLANAVGILNV